MKQGISEIDCRIVAVLMLEAVGGRDGLPEARDLTVLIDGRLGTGLGLEGRGR